MQTQITNSGIRRSVKRLFPLFVLPALICFLMSFVLPFVQAVRLSFCDFNIPKDAAWAGIQNYKNVFADSGFWHAFLMTMLFTLVSVIAINVPAFFLGYFLKDKFRGVTVFRTSFFIPNLIGGVVLGYIWSMLFDGILSFFGKYLTENASFGFWGLVIMVAWQQIGYMMIIYIAGFQSVPSDMLEAADMDGATGSQKLFRIILPNMLSTVFVCTFLTLTNCFKLFDQNLALTGGAPIRTLANGMQMKTTELLALNIYSTYNINRYWHGTAQAKAVVFFLLVGAIAGTQLWLTRDKDESAEKSKKGAAKA